MCVWLWNTWNNPYATDTYLFPILLSLFFSLLIFHLLFRCTLFCFGRFDFWFGLRYVRSCRVCFSFYTFQFISLFTFLWIVGFLCEFKAPSHNSSNAPIQKSTHILAAQNEERKNETHEWIDESQRQPLLNLLARLFALSLTHNMYSFSERSLHPDE